MSVARAQQAGLSTAYGPRHRSEREADALRILGQQVEELSGRLAILEAGLNGIVAPLMSALQLTPTEAQVLGFLLKRGPTTKQSLETVIYGLSDQPSAKSLDVTLHKLRRKLRVHAIFIRTEGRNALFLHPVMKGRVAEMLAAVDG